MAAGSIILGTSDSILYTCRLLALSGLHRLYVKALLVSRPSMRPFYSTTAAELIIALSLRYSSDKVMLLLVHIMSHVFCSFVQSSGFDKSGDLLLADFLVVLLPYLVQRDDLLGTVYDRFQVDIGLCQRAHKLLDPGLLIIPTRSPGERSVARRITYSLRGIRDGCCCGCRACSI